LAKRLFSLLKNFSVPRRFPILKSYKSIIEQAVLQAQSSEVVFRFLQENSASNHDLADSNMLLEDAELALFARRDPLINLGLAQFGRWHSTLKLLFQESSPLNAIKLSVLSNRQAGGAFFPVCLFENKTQMVEWLVNASDIELTALFENPKLDDLFITGFLKLAEPWSAIPDKRISFIVGLFQNNERFRQAYDDAYFDGSAAASYSAVFDAGWGLSSRVEVNDSWASALSGLYQQLLPESWTVKEPLQIAERWLVEPRLNGKISPRDSYINRNWLSSHQGVRKGLARLALSENKNLVEFLLQSDDPAFRAAVYSESRLNPSQIIDAYKRDGDFAFTQSIRNEKNWVSEDSRGVFRKIAGFAATQDSEGLDLVNLLVSVESHMQKAHPEWFE
jgi:hypothetical protein